MRLALFAAMLLLAGCSDNRSFDERYSDTERNIHEQGNELNAELNASESREE